MTEMRPLNWWFVTSGTTMLRGGAVALRGKRGLGEPVAMVDLSCP